jgi:hypothetical protein
MIIVSTFFDREPKYRKLLNVFYNSASEVMPNSEIRIFHVEPNQKKYGDDRINNHHWDTYFAFMRKITEAYIISKNERENVLMSDCDMMFYKSVNDIWCEDFDIAITVRDHRCKYNTGICFVKPTIAAGRFLEHWENKTREIAHRFDLNEINRYWGIDQASLAATLTEFQDDIKVLELPCAIWNAEQNCWRNLSYDVRAVHIKSGLRKIFFGKQQMVPKHNYLNPILERAKKYENTRASINIYKPTTDEDA